MPEPESVAPKAEQRRAAVAGGRFRSHFIQQRRTLAPNDLLQVARQIAQAMQAAHQQEILHRDLKPDHVLVRKEGALWKVKIIDFGLALQRHTLETSLQNKASGQTIFGDSVAGTIKYAPPEQLGELKGVSPGPYSDVFAFGKLCCFALFQTTEPKDRHWQTVPDNLRGRLKKMLEQCREEELVYRFASFEPVLKVLETLEAPKPVPLSPKPPRSTPRRRRSRNNGDLPDLFE